MDTRLLENLLAIPTAPFREHQIRAFIVKTFQKRGVPCFTDPIGNLVIGASSPSEYGKVLRAHKQPLFFLIAHMDHPGFHGVSWSDARTLKIRWHGGSPTRGLNECPVWATSGPDLMRSAVLSRVQLNKRGSAIESGLVRFQAEDAALLHQSDPKQIFGSFRFPKPVWKKGSRIYTKAADDLVGCFTIASLALAQKRWPSNFVGLLTRAEEVGFIGALSHLEFGWLKRSRREIICVSLETSRQLPGAVVGQGPIVRLGDRATVFDPSGVQYLTELSERVLKGKYQRRIMDGGTCEGTATTTHGLRTLAITIPLGNYHNQPLDEGRRGSAPEFVDLADVRGMLHLCQELINRPPNWNSVWNRKRNQFKKLLSTYSSLLRG